MAGWKKVKLEDVALLKAGKFISAQMIAAKQDPVNIYPCFGGNGTRGFVPNFSHEGFFPIIGRQGALCGNVNLAQGKFYATEHAVVASPKNGNNSIWLYYALLFANLNQYATGQAQPGISVETINKVAFLLPPLEEQKKIAATLSVWDSAIEKMEKLIDAKENHFNQLMNKLIVINSSNSKWNTFALKNVFEVVNRKNKNGNTNILTSSAQYGLVNQQEYYKKKIASSNTSGYYLLKKGDFAYNRSYSTGYPYGVVKRLDKYELGVLSTLYLCFSLKKEYQSYSDFFVFLFESGCLNNQLALICREGARNHGLLNVSKEDFFNMKVQLPNEKEQQSIVCILHNHSLELSLLKQQLENYKKQKQGLMQKLLTGQWRVK